MDERATAAAPIPETVLAGGRATAGVVRIGATVRRPATGDRTFTHACLDRLAAAGFAGTPRFLGRDEQDRDILTFLPGDVPANLGHYADAQLAAAARLLRHFHDGTSDWVARSYPGFVACHNDFAPTNTVFRNGVPVAMIDFDTLRPGTRLWDLGYSAFTWLDLGNDDYSGAEQHRRLGHFVRAYDHPDCPLPAVAVHAVARQTALAASAGARGLGDIALWARSAAMWTSLHLLQRILPTGYPDVATPGG